MMRTIASKRRELGFQNAKAVGGDEILKVANVIISREFAECRDFLHTSILA